MRDQQDWTRWFNEVNFFKIGSRISKIGLPAEFQNRLEIITASLSYSAQARFPHVEIVLDPTQPSHSNIFTQIFSWVEIFFTDWQRRPERKKHSIDLSVLWGHSVLAGGLSLYWPDLIWWLARVPGCLLPIRSAILTPLYQTAGLRTVMSRTRPALQWEENWTSPLSSLLCSDQDEGCSYGRGGDIEKINIGTRHHRWNWKHR